MRNILSIEISYKKLRLIDFVVSGSFVIFLLCVLYFREDDPRFVYVAIFSVYLIYRALITQKLAKFPQWRKITAHLGIFLAVAIFWGGIFFDVPDTMQSNEVGKFLMGYFDVRFFYTCIPVAQVFDSLLCIIREEEN